MSDDEWKDLKEVAEEAVGKIVDERDPDISEPWRIVEELSILSAVGYASDLTIVKLLMEIRTELRTLNEAQAAPGDNSKAQQATYNVNPHKLDAWTCRKCGHEKPRFAWDVKYFWWSWRATKTCAGGSDDELDVTCSHCGYEWVIRCLDSELLDGT